MPAVHLDIHTDDKVAVLRMDMGDNQLHPDLMAELLAHLDALEGDTSAQALVLTGTGKNWSPGLHLGWLMGHARDPQAVLGYLRTMNALYRRLCLYPKPVVAALNGHTFGGGVFLAAHCDLRLMGDDRGWVCLPESDIDIPLLPGMIAICEAVMPPQGFRQLYWTGRRFGGPQAVELGFVDAVYPADALIPEAIALAAALGRKRTDTWAEMKRRLRQRVVDVMDAEDEAQFLPTLMFPMKR